MFKNCFIKYLFIFFLFSGCGYRTANVCKVSLSVPYVIGDDSGILTKEIVYEMTKAHLRYLQDGGDRILKVQIIEDYDDQIGYRYDRNKDGSLKKNIMSTENRKHVKAKLELMEGEKSVFSKIVQVDMDYDYVIQDSLQDLSFIAPNGRQTVLSFSLGQLESIESAEVAAKEALYKKLAKRIVEVLLLEYFF